MRTCTAEQLHYFSTCALIPVDSLVQLRLDRHKLRAHFSRQVSPTVGLLLDGCCILVLTEGPAHQQQDVSSEASTEERGRVRSHLQERHVASFAQKLTVYVENLQRLQAQVLLSPRDSAATGMNLPQQQVTASD